MAASYPGAVKTYTDKTDNVDTVYADDVNALQDEVTAVETELGVDPAGTFDTVVLRLDDIESDVDDAESDIDDLEALVDQDVTTTGDVTHDTLTLTTGAYFGGTGASHLLDDYETGTWTPSIGGTATYNDQLGYYTKVGRLVLCQFAIRVLENAGASNNITGLPFTALDVTYLVGTGATAYTQNIDFGGDAPMLRVLYNTTEISCFGFNNNAARVVADFSTFGADEYMYGYVMFITA
jgi:hypothetical protein